MPTTATPRSVRRAQTRAVEGVVTAVVAVTGVRDHVDDIIVPGAFKRTFGIRRPKVVFHHDWLRFLGRVLHMVELMPGDPRLPKQTKEGQPWPAGAGAVVAVMQMNMATQAGRDGFEWARFYTESNECEWSVGYKVVPGKASKGRDGIRYIYDLDVYEFSLVLFGAASLSMTMDVKSVEGHDGLEAKVVPIGAVLLDEVLADFQRKALETKAAEKMVGSGVMVALYPPAAVAQQLAVPDGTGPDDLHVTLAFLGDAADLPGEPEALADVVRDSLGSLGLGTLTGSVGGLGQFPDHGDGAPTYIPVDVPDLGRVREQIVAGLEQSPFSSALARNHGFTPHMTLGYDLDGVQPVPPTDVTFDTVHVVVGPDRIEIPLGGGLPLEGKAAAAVREAKQQMLGTTGHSAFDAVRQAKALVEGDRPTSRTPRRATMPGTMGKPRTAAAPPRTAKKPAVRASSGSGTFDESKHKRAPKGDPNGGQFVSKGSGYESTGRRGEAGQVTKAQQALIAQGFLGKNDGKDGRGDDGYFGRKTEAAVKKWQSKMGYEPTGKLSGEQMKQLTSGAKPKAGQPPRNVPRVRRGAPATARPVLKAGQPKPPTPNPRPHQPPRTRVRSGPDKAGRQPGDPAYGADPGYDENGKVVHTQPDLAGREPGSPDYGADAVYDAQGNLVRYDPDDPDPFKGKPVFDEDGTPLPQKKPRTQTKSAWDTVAEANRMRAGLEGKYDTSSLSDAGNGDNWIEQVDGELPAFVRAVAHALIRERGMAKSKAIQVAIGTIQRWATGGGDVTEKTRAKAIRTVAAWEALKAKARATPPKMEAKHMHQEMPGSFEQVRDQLRQAAHDLFCKKTDSGSGGVEIGGEWVSVEATYPTHAIVSHEHDGKTTTYQVPYTATGGEVTLGKPEEITLRVVAEPADGGEIADASEDDAAEVRFLQPAAGLLDEATAMLMMSGTAGKADETLRPALLRLVDALACKGMALDDDDIDDEDDVGDSTDDGPADDEPVAAQPLSEQLVDEPAEDEIEDELEEKVILDPDEVAAQLAALR